MVGRSKWSCAPNYDAQGKHRQTRRKAQLFTLIARGTAHFVNTSHLYQSSQQGENEANNARSARDESLLARSAGAKQKKKKQGEPASGLTEVSQDKDKG